MTEQEILKHNERMKKRIDKITNEIINLKSKRESLEHQLIAPCQFCNYDGEYRCQACVENGYEGFNISDYPRMD